MAKQSSVEPINFFDLANYSGGGGGYFRPGPTRIVSAVFTTFDYGKPGNDANVMRLVLQPLNPKTMEDEGEEKIQYYGVGDKTVLLNPIKGQKGCYEAFGLAEDSPHDKIFGFSDLSFFMRALAKAGYAMDEAAADITVLDGLLANMDFVVKPANPNAEKPKDSGKGGKEAAPKEQKVIVVTDLLDESGEAKGGEKEEEEEKEEKPSKGKDKPKGGKAKVEVDDDEDSIIEAYIDHLKSEGELDGMQPLSFRLNILDYAVKELGKDKDLAGKAKDLLKSKIDVYLKGAGFKVVKGVIKED